MLYTFGFYDWHKIPSLLHSVAVGMTAIRVKYETNKETDKEKNVKHSIANLTYLHRVHSFTKPLLFRCSGSSHHLAAMHVVWVCGPCPKADS